MPGQFKAIPNTIGRHRLTPPRNVAGTFRVLLTDIRPTLRDPWQRAVFMYIALILVHGFADGNGRLARFILCAEAEAAGLPAIVIPLQMRTEVAAAVEFAWIEGRLEPLLESLVKACGETNRFLEELDNC
jgi:fido (protein-threonine AMPylation protein)